jgi:hypothetical protein
MKIRNAKRAVSVFSPLRKRSLSTPDLNSADAAFDCRGFEPPAQYA